MIVSASISICRSAAPIVVCVVLGATPGTAWAQACCSGSTAFAPARLSEYENLLAGVAVKASGLIGSADARRRFVASPAYTHELGLEQQVFGAARLFDRLQLSLVVPIVETWRYALGRSAIAGGFGDLQLGARYDFTRAGVSRWLPGLALLSAVTIPSGQPSQNARAPLAVDATGIGAWQLTGGAAIEQAFGAWLINVTATVAWRSPQQIGDFQSELGASFAVFAALAYAATDDVVIAMTAAYAAELDAAIDGRRLQNSARASTRLAVNVGYLITSDWRLQASVFSDVPLRWLALNQPLSAGASFGVIRAW